MKYRIKEIKDTVHIVRYSVSDNPYAEILCKVMLGNCWFYYNDMQAMKITKMNGPDFPDLAQFELPKGTSYTSVFCRGYLTRKLKETA